MMDPLARGFGYDHMKFMMTYTHLEPFRFEIGDRMTGNRGIGEVCIF